MAYIDDWESLSKPDPEWEETAKARFGSAASPLSLPGFPDVLVMREKVTAAKRAMTSQLGGKIDGVLEKDHEVRTRDGTTIICRTYEPEAKGSGTPGLLVVFHGGAWCIGGLENEELLCRLVTSTYGMVCVNVDYRLAPENKFPTGFYDCLDATQWAAANASRFGADPNKSFVLSGTSAGGNFAAGVTAAWHEQGLSPPITGCHLMVAMLTYYKYIPDEYRASHRSWEQNVDAPILNPSFAAPFLDNYIPNDDDRRDPRFNVLVNTAALKAFPPTHLQVAGWDAVRDDSLILEKALRSVGRKTRLDVYPGQPHGFWSLLPQMAASKNFVNDYIAGIKWLIE